MRRRRKVLVLTPYPLLPAHSGGRLYALSTVAPVADEHEFHLLALANAGERDELARGGDALRAEYARLFASVSFEERPKIPHELGSRAAVLRHFAVHVRHRLPLMDLSYYQPRAVELARRIVRERGIDLLEIHHLHCAFYRRFLPDVPAILINHNIEQDLWPFWPKQHGFAPERWLWNQLGKLSRRFAYQTEIENALAFDAKVFVSTRDMERVPEAACPRFLVPMAVPLQPAVEPFSRDRFKVLWIGGFGWPPNVEAVTLVPRRGLARACAPRRPFRWSCTWSAPRRPTRCAPATTGARSSCTATSTTSSRLRADADAFVVPLLTGSGVRIKIVEALAAGLPVVSTAKGCEGLPVQPGRDLLVADDAPAFAAHLIALAASVERRAALGRAGRIYAEQHHSPEVVAAAKRRVYDALDGGAAQGATPRT